MSTTTYPLDAPARRPADPYFAQDNEAVYGKDLRVNAAGGVQYTAATDAADLIPLSGGDFDQTWVGIPTEGTFCVIEDTTGSASVSFYIVAGTLYAHIGATDTSLGAPPTTLTAYRISFVAAPGVYTFYIGGVLVRTSAGALAAPAFTKRDGFPAPFTGFTYRSRVANFVPTTDEAAGAAKGESRGRLVNQGKTYASAGTFAQLGGSGTNTVSSASSTGFTATCTVAGDGKFSPDASPLAPSVAVGQYMVATVDIVYTGTAPTAPAQAGSRYDWEAPVVASSVVGNTHTFIIPNATAYATMHPFLYLASAVGTVATVSNWKVIYQGTLQDIRPEEWTTLNRGLDASGNGYHLLPVAGARAMNPQVPRWRTYSYGFNLVTPAFLGGELPPGWATVNRIYAGGVWTDTGNANDKSYRITATAGNSGGTDADVHTALRKGPPGDSAFIVSVWSGGLKVDVDTVDITASVYE
jgi:hypothetical protein